MWLLHFFQQHPPPPLQLPLKDHLIFALLLCKVVFCNIFFESLSPLALKSSWERKTIPWPLTRLSGNEILAQSNSSCPSRGLLGIPHQPELKHAGANGGNCWLMSYANEAVWSSTFPFLPTVGVRVLSPLQEPTGNATVTLYASILVCIPASPLWLVIQKLHHYKYKKPNFLLFLLLSFSSSYHTAWATAIFLPLEFNCWCDTISTEWKKLTVTCQCIDDSWLRDAGMSTLAFRGTPPRQLGSFWLDIHMDVAPRNYKQAKKKRKVLTWDGSVYLWGRQQMDTETWGKW